MIVERQVDLKGFIIDLHQWLIKREWNSFCQFECATYGSWVCEFFNNIHYIGQAFFKTFVCGITIEINLSYLSQFLEIDKKYS